MNDSRPFVDRPVPDRDAAIAAATRQAVAWGLPAPAVLRHGMNTLLACDDVVLRVGAASAPADRAHALAHWLVAAGVPTVEPVDGMAADVDGLAITGWRRIDAVDVDRDWEAVGRAVHLVHSLPVDGVPDGYPVPCPSTFPWLQFDTMLADVIGEIDAASFDALHATVDKLSDWPDRVRSGAVLCHGDVHPGNVMVTRAGTVLIDWDLLCVANPAWDHAMLTTYADRWGGDLTVLPSFRRGYDEGVDDELERDVDDELERDVNDELARDLGRLRNVAATLMRVKAGRTDPVAAAEAEQRLRYWRGDPTAPMWQAQ